MNWIIKYTTHKSSTQTLKIMSAIQWLSWKSSWTILTFFFSKNHISLFRIGFQQLILQQTPKRLGYLNTLMNCLTLVIIRFERRPSQDCVAYQPPGVAGIFGDPHIVTFDDLQYTFNGKGTYIIDRWNYLKWCGKMHAYLKNVKYLIYKISIIWTVSKKFCKSF